MKGRLATTLLLLVTAAGALSAHDLFFRANSFHITAGSVLRLRALNGTFSKSENAVARDRLRDLSVVSPDGHLHPDTAMWSSTGDTSVFTHQTGAAGTYLIGASLKPREITLKAEDFNHYLADDGIPDVLAARKRNGEMGKGATERYSKHIKALVQVGNTRSAGFDADLHYPAELIPLDNPYSKAPGSTLRFKAMVDGAIVPNQLVVAGGRTPSGARHREIRVRTGTDGVARIKLAGRGQWYVKFIHMVPFEGTQPAEKIDYESKWATLTFETR